MAWTYQDTWRYCVEHADEILKGIQAVQENRRRYTHPTNSTVWSDIRLRETGVRTRAASQDTLVCGPDAWDSRAVTVCLISGGYNYALGTFTRDDAFSISAYTTEPEAAFGLVGFGESPLDYSYTELMAECEHIPNGQTQQYKIFKRPGETRFSCDNETIATCLGINYHAASGRNYWVVYPNRIANQYGTLTEAASARRRPVSKPLKWCSIPGDFETYNEYEVKPKRCCTAERKPKPKENMRGSRKVGVEIEVNGLSRFSRVFPLLMRYGYAVHSDGSAGVNADRGGWECVSPPTPYAQVGKTVKPLCTALIKAGEAVNSRCGLHVHVDARDLKDMHVGRLLRVWKRVEILMYLLAGQNRYRNDYTRPTASHIDLNESVKMQIADLCGNGRYYALNASNLRTAAYRGKRTIEFRLHKGTLDGARIAGWAYLLGSMVTACKSMPKALFERILSLKSPLKLLCALCPRSKRWIVKRINAYRKATCLDPAKAEAARSIRWLPDGTLTYITGRRKGERSGFRLPPSWAGKQYPLPIPSDILNRQNDSDSLDNAIGF